MATFRGHPRGPADILTHRGPPLGFANSRWEAESSPARPERSQEKDVPASHGIETKVNVSAVWMSMGVRRD